MATKAYTGPVEINGIKYQVKGQVFRQAMEEWPNASPATNQQIRESRRFSNSYGVKTIQGLLIDRDYDGKWMRAYDSTIETRFQYQFTLPGLWVAEPSWGCDTLAVNGNDMSLVGGVEFDNEVWMLHGQTVATVPKLYARRYNEATEAWDATEEIRTGGATYLPHDLKKHGAFMFAVFSSGTNRYLYRRALGSSTWTDLSTFGSLGRCFTQDNSIPIVLTDYTTQINEATANDVPLFVNKKVGDWVKFGFNKPTNTLTLNVGTVRSGAVGDLVVQWEYDAGLEAGAEVWLQPEEVVDGTNSFLNAGINSITFKMPDNPQYPWVSTSEMNSAKYYLRCRVISVAAGLVTTPILTQGWAAGLPTVQAANDRTLLLSIGDTLLMAEWVAATGVVTIYYSLDNGVSFPKTASTIKSAFPPTSFIAYVNDDMEAVPYLGTAEGAWRWDTDIDNPDLVLPMPTHRWNCKGMAVWAGGLYVSKGSVPFGQLLEFKIQGGTRIISSVGLDNGSGLPASRHGFIIDLRDGGAWLLALTRNDSTNHASVFAFDGAGWHHVYNSNTSSGDWLPSGTKKAQLMTLSTVDTTQRLHLAFEVDSSNVDAVHVKNPLRNPLTLSTFDYEDDGYLDLPRFAGGLPEHPANWLQAHIDADDLSATTAGEYVQLKYGKDGEARVDNTSGNFLSGAKDILMTTTKAGISSKTLAARIHFYRGITITNGPKVYEFKIEFVKFPLIRHVWHFVIDVDKSVAPNMLQRSNVVSNIEAVEASITQVTFSVAGLTQVYVKCLPPTLGWGFAPGGGIDDPFESLNTAEEGTLRVTAMELIA